MRQEWDILVCDQANSCNNFLNGQSCVLRWKGELQIDWRQVEANYRKQEISEASEHFQDTLLRSSLFSTHEHDHKWKRKVAVFDIDK